MSNRELISIRPELANARPPLKVAASTTIYKGDFVCKDSSGDAVQAPADGSLIFMGIAKNYYANSAVTATSARELQFDNLALIEHAVTGAAVTNIGAKVYYTGAQTLSMTIVATTGVAGSQVGRLHGFTAAGVPIVDLTKNEY